MITLALISMVEKEMTPITMVFPQVYVSSALFLNNEAGPLCTSEASGKNKEFLCKLIVLAYRGPITNINKSIRITPLLFYM